MCLCYQVFHWCNFHDEYRRIYQRLGGLQYLLFSWIMWLLKILFLTILGPSCVGFHTTFGDGTELPEAHMSHLRDVIWNNMVFNRWEKGDLLVIDNRRISHGRQVGCGKARADKERA